MRFRFYFRVAMNQQAYSDWEGAEGSSSLASTMRKLKEALEDLAEVENLVFAISGSSSFLASLCTSNKRE
jgi:hypothetical protein